MNSGLAISVGPTDSLWKFTAVTGLLLTLALIGIYFREVASLAAECDKYAFEQRSTYSSTIRAVDENTTDARWLQLSMKPFLDSVIAGKVRQGDLSRLEVFKSRADALDEKQRQWQEWWDEDAAKLERLKSHADRVRREAALLGGAISLSMLLGLFGFWKWYWVHQRRVDLASP